MNFVLKIFTFSLILSFSFFYAENFLEAAPQKTQQKKKKKAKNEEKNEKIDLLFEKEENHNSISSQYNLSALPHTSAKQALLEDVDSGAILFEKNADELMSPSSMTKIATACFVANKINSGEIFLDTTFSVSRNAYRREGSTMFLNLGQKVSVADLLEGLIVASANDAGVTLSEGICGSEEIFAKELTAFVKSYGAVHTNFVNSNGLPAPDHKTTARDLSIIAKHALTDYPEIYTLYSQKQTTFNGITQSNKNVLLNKNIGCDGIKTGHTNDGGFGIVATCVQNNRRLLLVVNGYKSEQERSTDASSLITWGGKMFINHDLYKSNELIAQIPVWYGEESYLPVTVERNLAITLPRSSQYDAKILLCYDTPISAPIPKGTPVGEIRITSSTFKTPIVIPLIAAISIQEAGFLKKLKDSFLYLIWGAKKPEIIDEKLDKINEKS